MKKHSQFAAAIVALAIAGTLPLLAQNPRIYRDGSSWVEELTGTMPASRVLKVQTDLGSVQVQGDNSNEIHYTIRKRSYAGSEEAARRAFSQMEFNAARRGDVATFEGSARDSSGRKFSAEFNLVVPHNFELANINTDGGAITVSGVTAKIQAESGGGAIQFDTTNGPASAETGGGNITVGTVQGPLSLRTGGGSIHVNSTNGHVIASSGGGSIYIGSAAGVDVETGGGSINVVDCKGDSGAKAQTGGGSIEMGEVAGTVSLGTGGGSIHLSGAKGFVKAETGGGSIELLKLSQGARAETGAGTITAEFVTNNGTQPSYLETNAGDVIVYLNPSVKITVDAAVENAYGHKIRSDFAELKVTSEGGNFGPRSYFAEGSLNGGGPVLKVRTTLGSIEFRKR